MYICLQDPLSSCPLIILLFFCQPSPWLSSSPFFYLPSLFSSPLSFPSFIIPSPISSPFPFPPLFHPPFPFFTIPFPFSPSPPFYTLPSPFSPSPTLFHPPLLFFILPSPFSPSPPLFHPTLYFFTLPSTFSPSPPLLCHPLPSFIPLPFFLFFLPPLSYFFLLPSSSASASGKFKLSPISKYTSWTIIIKTCFITNEQNLLSWPFLNVYLFTHTSHL